VLIPCFRSTLYCVSLEVSPISLSTSQLVAAELKETPAQKSQKKTLGMVRQCYLKSRKLYFSFLADDCVDAAVHIVYK